MNDTNDLLTKTSKNPKPLYTIREEIAHSVTSIPGVIFGIAGLIFLIYIAASYKDIWQIISFSIYGVSFIILYLASTLYHSFQKPRIKKAFQKFDHAAIYLLIAGTYTPFLLIRLRGAWGWTLLAVVWGIALLGISFKALFMGKAVKLSILGYVLMGWLGVIAGKQMLVNIPHISLYWLAIGGVLYTSGIFFLAWRKIPYNHAIWHLFVLAGSISHFIAIYQLTT
jgi:hemolysin III